MSASGALVGGPHDAVTGLFLILAISALNAFIASKRRRSAAAFLGISLFPMFPLLILAGVLSHGDGVAMGWGAFIGPIVGFILSLTVKNGRELVASGGMHQDFIACPYCAESVRRQATKCRHCASDLPPRASIQQSAH